MACSFQILADGVQGMQHAPQQAFIPGAMSVSCCAMKTNAGGDLTGYY